MLEILGGSSPQVESRQTTPYPLMSYSYGWSEDTGCRVALSIQSPRSDKGRDAAAETREGS